MAEASISHISTAPPTSSAALTKSTAEPPPLASEAMFDPVAGAGRPDAGHGRQRVGDDDDRHGDQDGPRDDALRVFDLGGHRRHRLIAGVHPHHDGEAEVARRDDVLAMSAGTGDTGLPAPLAKAQTTNERERHHDDGLNDDQRLAGQVEAADVDEREEGDEADAEHPAPVVAEAPLALDVAAARASM